MTDADDEAIDLVDGNSSRDLFPGYYSLSEGERSDAFKRGLVSLDANALLDLYRFTPKARQEFLAVLTRMKRRLFLTHQAAGEFHRNRLKVFDDRIESTGKESNEIADGLKQAIGKIAGFARRYQIAESERIGLLERVDLLVGDVQASLHEASVNDLKREDVRASVDVVSRQFDELFAGRIGAPLDDRAYKAALEEAARRKTHRIPPGYMDQKKGDPEREAGDYLVWYQLIAEARHHNRPVLLICNEDKEDWVVKYRGETLGPRPELALELKTEAATYLYMVNVQGLLLNARKYLGTTVSDSTLAEAEAEAEEDEEEDLVVRVGYSRSAMRAFRTLSTLNRAALATAVAEVKSSLNRHGLLPGSLEAIEMQSGPDTRCWRMRFGDGCNAVLAVRRREDASTNFLTSISVIVLTIQDPASPRLFELSDDETIHLPDDEIVPIYPYPLPQPRPR